MSDAQFAPMLPPTYHPARGVPPGPALGPHVGGRTEDQHSTDGECDERCTMHEYPRRSVGHRSPDFFITGVDGESQFVAPRRHTMPSAQAAVKRGVGAGVRQSANLRGRPGTFFAPHSPRVSQRWTQSANSFGNWRARQDSNLRPSATKTRQRGRAVCVREGERCLDRLPSPAPVTVRRSRHSSEESCARSRPAPTPRASGRRAG